MVSMAQLALWLLLILLVGYSDANLDNDVLLQDLDCIQLVRSFSLSQHNLWRKLVLYNNERTSKLKENNHIKSVIILKNKLHIEYEHNALVQNIQTLFTYITTSIINSLPCRMTLFLAPSDS